MAKRKQVAPAPDDDAPRCAFGNTTDPSTGQAPGYTGPGHCDGCYAETQRLSAGFAEGGARGDLVAGGFAPGDWRLLERAGAGAAADAPDLPPTPDAPEHFAICRAGQCRAALKYRVTSHGGGVMQIETMGVDFDQVFAFSRAGVPICPHGHGEMVLQDEDVPVAEAITTAAAAASVPSQAQLFELAKPFNFEGAWLEIESKQGEIDELARDHEHDAEEAKKSRKALEEARTTLGLMVNRWREQRLKKDRDQQNERDRREAAARAADGATSIDAEVSAVDAAAPRAGEAVP